MLRLLVKYTPSTLPYHIIVPSLPGYTLSSPPPTDRDFRLEDAAALLDQLMRALTFDKYVVQGGDVGSKLARVLGGTTNNGSAAIHLNFCIMPEPSDPSLSTTYNALEQEGLERTDWFTKLGSAYALEHATRPSIIGLMLHSSPLALLAWIGEKFLEWSDEPHLPTSTILADVTLYWLTNCASTCLWPYCQLFTPGVVGAHENPNGISRSHWALAGFPRRLRQCRELGLRLQVTWCGFCSMTGMGILLRWRDQRLCYKIWRTSLGQSGPMSGRTDVVDDGLTKGRS